MTDHYHLRPIDITNLTTGKPKKETTTMTIKNTPEQIIREQAQRIKELEAKLEKAFWRIKNQKGEIRRLNSANIKKIHLISKREETINDLKKGS